MPPTDPTPRSTPPASTPRYTYRHPKLGAAPAPSLDSVTTIRADGSRPFLYPADTHGRFTRARRWSALALIAFYLSLPWIKIGGYPAAFDAAEKQFRASEDAVLRSQLLGAMGSTKDPALNERVRALAP